MKKIFSIVLAMVMLFSLGTAAFAAEISGSDATGKITISNAVPKEDYAIYQIAELEKFDTATGMYLYTVATGWENFFTAPSEDTPSEDTSAESTLGKGLEYVEKINIDGKDYLTWKGNVKTDAATVKAFADAAYKYATANKIPAMDKKTAKETTVVFDGLEHDGLALGYYLVKSSLGTIVSLDSTDTDVEIQEKNGIPTVDKEIVDSDKTPDESTASIGDDVKYKTTVSVEAGAFNYILHDTMSKGLTFNNDIVVTVDGVALTDTEYEVLDHDEHSFTIKFADEYIAGIAGKDIVVTYSATLNEDAVIAGEGNPNETYLTYGEKNSETNHDETVTYTYEFQLVKTTNANKVLENAKFKLYTVNPATEGAKAVALVATDNGYRVAKDGETPTTDVVVAGRPMITGLKNGTYYLVETEAPAGYNKTDAVITVTIADANNTASFDAVQKNEYESGGVQVINNTGLELPSTGGIGTTIFYIIGGILVVGAGIFMVVRKRMSAEKA